MEISLAETDESRQDAQAFFEQAFPGDSRIAVPSTIMDLMYRTLLVQVRDDEGRLVAAAMSVEPHLTSGLGVLPPEARPAELVKVAGKVSELDRIAVLPEHRGQGLGRRMLEFLEPHLAERGVQTWFGSANEREHVVELRRFFEGSGFTVLTDGKKLPPFHGLTWYPESLKNPPLWFWKNLRR